MTVFLVRHAVAVGRSGWDGDDEIRPLTKKGHRQARTLVDLLADADIRRVLSSPALRCRDTVAPIAAKLGVPVEDSAPLAEGHAAEGTVALVRALAADPGDVALCTHGDLVPEVVRRLARDGMAWDGDLRYAKGSTWVLEWDGDRCIAGRYVPPHD